MIFDVLMDIYDIFYEIDMNQDCICFAILAFFLYNQDKRRLQ